MAEPELLWSAAKSLTALNMPGLLHLMKTMVAQGLADLCSHSLLGY